MAEWLPISYVREFAGRQFGIDTVGGGPLCGLDVGSTHVRDRRERAGAGPDTEGRA